MCTFSILANEGCILMQAFFLFNFIAFIHLFMYFGGPIPFVLLFAQVTGLTLRLHQPPLCE